jgi:hypothetical protein
MRSDPSPLSLHYHFPFSNLMPYLAPGDLGCLILLPFTYKDFNGAADVHRCMLLVVKWRASNSVVLAAFTGINGRSTTEQDVRKTRERH